ncbi:MAG: glycoside hydrolase family 9 protein [Spirochaetaceae bacterium]|nr:MAG: glycoside hydrolase family 9 protein [Spirochaetaceae bacterium]
MEVFINHIGYDTNSSKKAIVRDRRTSNTPEQTLEFRLADPESDRTVFKGRARFIGPVARWRDWRFWTLDFSALTLPGNFIIELPVNATSSIRSAPFEVAEDLLLHKSLMAVLQYFRSQRCSDIWDQADHSVGFVGSRNDRVDVHGGWYDASGDISKYLSHLSYANYMNPQQTPMAVWNFLEARDLLGIKAAGSSTQPASILQSLRADLLEEALYGADFLVRMQDPAGYFYVTVFDRWSKDPEQREICSFRTQAGNKYDDYQAGYRQGGGLAIAALARISILGVARDFGPDEYFRAALTGFQHLEEHNLEYLDDGRENIIDEYCALLAAAELYNAGRFHGIADTHIYLEAARRRASQLIGRLSTDEHYRDWWRADKDSDRPYFHAAEAGLPAISLLRYRDLEPDKSLSERALAAVRCSLLFELSVTTEVPNPFGYARQYVRSVGGSKRSAFFIPHANETGYWWQGEDARLASLAAAARMAAACLSPDLANRLAAYAQDQLNWILGLNPFDTCMLHGFGRNNPEYESNFSNAFGGICNGITAGFSDEEDIDFLPDPYAGLGEHRWRWSEQWIPHAAWYLLAVCAG